MEKRLFYKRVAKLAIPVAFESLVYNLINFIDIFMVGKNNPELGLGANAISALGVSNQFFFLFSVSLFGLLSGANILSSQYYGAKDLKNLRKVISLSLIVSVIFMIPFFIMARFYSNEVIRFYTSSPKVIELGIRYLKVISFTFIIVSINYAFTMTLRAINLPKYSLYSALAGLLINLCLNLTLIPIYGVVGAAYATVTARVVVLIMVGIILIKRSIPIIPGVRDVLAINTSFIKKFFSMSLMTFTHEIFWSTAISAKAAMYGRMGAVAFSSIQIANNISGLLFTFFVGLSDATAVIIGNELGRGNKEGAFSYSKECLKLFSKVAVLVFIALFTISPYILKAMGVSSRVYNETLPVMRVVCFTMLFSAITLIFLIGFLRAGGDVKFAFLAEILPLWLIGLPITYLAVIYFKLPVAVAYFIANLDELVKMIPCGIRYAKKKWLNVLV